MEIVIKDTKENKLLNRTEVNFELTYEQAPPRRADIQSALAGKVDAKPQLIMIQKVVNVFGVRKGVGRANIYKNKEDLEKIERKQIKKRWSKAEDVKPTESPAQPAKEEPPKKETNVDETPAEEKKEGEA